MNLWLLHPDPSVRQALLTTLQNAWKEMNFQSVKSEELPIPFPAQDIILSPTLPDGVPPGQVLILNQGPVRIKSLLLQLDTLLQQTYWPAQLEFAGAHLNTRTREWHSGTSTLTLTEKEVAVLMYLWQRPDPALREDLLRDVWHYASDADTHTIETHIYRLRQKIETDPANPQFLLTTKDGYQLAARTRA